MRRNFEIYDSNGSYGDRSQTDGTLGTVSLHILSYQLTVSARA